MRKIIVLSIIASLSIACTGCLFESGLLQSQGSSPHQPREVPSSDVLAIRNFVNDAKYDTPPCLPSGAGGIIECRDSHRTFVIDTSRWEVMAAEIKGREEVFALSHSLPYARTREAVRIFLGVPDFAYSPEEFIFRDGYYEMGAGGTHFRVNVSTGRVTRAFIDDPSLVSSPGINRTFQEALRAKERSGEEGNHF
ncbi:MAG: hypothetical protein NQU46_00855 [Methanolinea sp.]|nr:hypothetical protein [Methanolinea sp.]